MSYRLWYLPVSLRIWSSWGLQGHLIGRVQFWCLTRPVEGCLCTWMMKLELSALEATSVSDTSVSVPALIKLLLLLLIYNRFFHGPWSVFFIQVRVLLFCEKKNPTDTMRWLTDEKSCNLGSTNPNLASSMSWTDPAMTALSASQQEMLHVTLNHEH